MRLATAGLLLFALALLAHSPSESRGGSGESILFWADAPQPSGERKRILATPQLEQPADWSPNGKTILFTRFYLAGGSDVLVVDIDDSRVSRLTRAPGEDTAAAWSPDGSKILFTSERTGRPQVFVMSADGSNQRNISRTRSDDLATDWH